jgi:hypothetical protein
MFINSKLKIISPCPFSLRIEVIGIIKPKLKISKSAPIVNKATIK